MFANFRRAADRLTEAAAVVVLVSLLGSVVLGVIGRALNEPIIWSDEMARYFMVWLALLGWMLASRRRSHIRITFILNSLPTRVRRVLEAVIQAAIVVFGGLLLWDGVILVERNLDIEAVSLPITASLLYVPVVLAGFATAIQAAAQIGELFLRPDVDAETPAGQVLL